MYDTTLGRFLRRDPDRAAARDVNLYEYARDSPTNLTDPSGRFPIILPPNFGLLLELAAPKRTTPRPHGQVPQARREPEGAYRYNQGENL